MTSLMMEWEEAVRREELNPDTHCYLLIDASQLPVNVIEWKDLIRGGGVYNLLWDQPEASHPEVCALLCDYSAPWVDAVLRRHLPRRPFAFMAISSFSTGSVLSEKLNARTKIVLPERTPGLLRFYDAAVFQALEIAFPKAHYSALLSPCLSWIYVRRDGTIGVTRHQRQYDHVHYSHVSSKEMEILRREGLPDILAAELRRNGRLAPDADPFESYHQIRQVVAVLKEYDMLSDAFAYQLSAILLAHPDHAIADEELKECVADHQHDRDALCEALRTRATDRKRDVVSRAANVEKTS